MEFSASCVYAIVNIIINSKITESWKKVHSFLNV